MSSRPSLREAGKSGGPAAFAAALAAAAASVALAVGATAWPGPAPGGAASLRGLREPAQDAPRRRAVEVAVPANDSDEAVLGRPLALAFDAGRLYVADALDCAVKVFASDGAFAGAFGRKGQGPGELSFPSGVCAAGGTIAVADKLNRRIQLFDTGGKLRGGFKLPFAPDRLVALGRGALLVTSNPSGRREPERLLHIYDESGRAVWEGLEAAVSSDPLGDAFRNMVLVCPGDRGGFYAVFRSGRRSILHYAAAGAAVEEIEVDARHVSREVTMPVGEGGLTLSGFCWAAACSGGLIYLAAPEALEGKDLGPGRSLSVLDGAGRLLSVIDLPCPVHRFLVAGDRIFAIDDEGGLRIFEVGR